MRFVLPKRERIGDRAASDQPINSGVRKRGPIITCVELGARTEGFRKLLY